MTPSFWTRIFWPVYFDSSILTRTFRLVYLNNKFPTFPNFPFWFLSPYQFLSSYWFLSPFWFFFFIDYFLLDFCLLLDFCILLGFYLLLNLCLLLSNSWFYLTALQLHHMLTAASVQWLMFLTEVYYSDDKPCFLVFSTSGQLLQ